MWTVTRALRPHLVTATLTATAITLRPTRWSQWTDEAASHMSGVPRNDPMDARPGQFDPRVLGSNPSGLTKIAVHGSDRSWHLRQFGVFLDHLISTSNAFHGRHDGRRG